jgi:hypothetical protein
MSAPNPELVATLLAIPAKRQVINYSDMCECTKVLASYCETCARNMEPHAYDSTVAGLLKYSSSLREAMNPSDIQMFDQIVAHARILIINSRSTCADTSKVIEKICNQDLPF